MKRFPVCLLLLFFFATIQEIVAQNDEFFRLADEFFNAVVINGRIDYQGLEEHPELLDRLTSYIADYNIQDKSDDILTAFYIDTYNILVINEIVNNLPLRSVNEVPGFFTFKRHSVAGEKITLETLEKRRIFKISNDPRIHFALVCGAKGCPGLPARAFLPDTLYQQLEEQTRKSVNDPAFIKVDHSKLRVDLSRIFFWYKKDFTEKGNDLLSYINGYRRDSIPESYLIRYYSYDWSLNDAGNDDEKVIRPALKNLQSYTPSVLLSKGQTEYTLFNNLYSQAQFFNFNRKVEADNIRSTFFTGILGFQYGLGNNVSIGFEAWFRSSLYDSTDVSPFKVFGFDNNPMARTAISGLGPKVRYSFSRLTGFSMQTTFLFPLANDLQGRTDPEDINNNRPFLDHDGYQLFHHFFYDTQLSRQVSIFAEAGIRILIDRKFKAGNTSIQTPFKLFISYFPGSRLSLYAMSEAAPNWNKAYYIQSGLGFKFQAAKHLELETLYTNFWAGRNSGAGYTLNLGLRVVY